MAIGDFVITPNWEWHDHGNTTDAPIFWLDGLDIPLVQFLDASFAEPLGEDEQPVGRPEGDSLARYGANMLPVGYEKRDADLADLQLSLRAQPGRARADAAQRAMGSVSRPQDALRQSGRRRVGDADDRRVPAAPAARAHDDAIPLDRCDRLRPGRGQRPGGRPAAGPSSGRRATSSSCRAGVPCTTNPARTRCSSATPTVPCRRSSGSGGSGAATSKGLPHHEMPNLSFMAGVLTQGSPGSRSTRVVNTLQNDSAVDSSVIACAWAAGSNGRMSNNKRGWASLANMRSWACAREIPRPERSR